MVNMCNQCNNKNCGIQVPHFWVNSLPPNDELCPNAIYFINNNGNIEMYVTSSIPEPYLVGGGNEENITITSPNNTISITFSGEDFLIDVSEILQQTISTALQPGDNISELNNDLGFSASQLEKVTEDGVTGYRILGSNPDKLLPIGASSIDLGFTNTDVPTNDYGVSNTFGFNIGADNKNHGIFGNMTMGASNENYGFAFNGAFGAYNVINSGYGTFLLGAYNTADNSNNGFGFASGMNNDIRDINSSAIGMALISKSRNTHAIGVSNTDYPEAGEDILRPLFIVGNGTTDTPAGRWNAVTRSDAFRVRYNGLVEAPSATNAIIIAGSGKSLITRDYFEEYSINPGLKEVTDVNGLSLYTDFNNQSAVALNILSPSNNERGSKFLYKDLDTGEGIDVNIQKTITYLRTTDGNGSSTELGLNDGRFNIQKIFNTNGVGYNYSVLFPDVAANVQITFPDKPQGQYTLATTDDIVGGNYIPLTGTTEGNSVAGDIKFNQNQNIGISNESETQYFKFFSDDAYNEIKGSTIINRASGNFDFGTDANNHGIKSNVDFTPNYPTDGTEDLIFPQIKWVKTYVDDAIAGVGGNQDLQSVLENGSQAQVNSNVQISQNFAGPGIISSVVLAGSAELNATRISASETSNVNVGSNSVYIASTGAITFNGASLNIQNLLNLDNTVTKGLARDTNGKVVEYDITTPDLTTYQLKSEKGQANGYASLDENGKVPESQIKLNNNIYSTVLEANQNVLNQVYEGRNRRDGKIVKIGSNGNYENYTWIGGFLDKNISKVNPPLFNEALGANLFDKNNVINGYYVEYTSGNLLPLPIASVFKLKVEVNALYKIKHSQQYAYFDINNNYLGGNSTTGDYGVIQITDINCNYVLLTVFNDDLDTQSIFKGGIELPYQKFKGGNEDTFIAFENIVENSRVIHVGNNAQYKTINEALSSIKDDTELNKYVLVLSPQIYVESVNLVGRYISLYGMDKENTIIKTFTNDYYLPPIDMACNNNLYNLTIIADKNESTPPDGVNGLKAYGIHFDIAGRFESLGVKVQGKALVQNCDVSSYYSHGIALGLWTNQTLIFENVEIFSNTIQAFRAHNYLPAGATNQKMFVKNCRIHNKGNFSPVALQDANQAGGTENRDTEFTFQNNIIWNDFGQVDLVDDSYYPAVDENKVAGYILKGKGSYGNNSDKLNFLTTVSGLNGTANNHFVTKQQVDLKANDADVLHKSGDELITGNKLIAIGKSINFFTDRYGIGTPDSAGLQIYSSNNDDVRIGTRNSSLIFTEIVKIAGSNGFVGINNTNPAERLDVIGNGKFSGTVSGASATANNHLVTKQQNDLKANLNGNSDITITDATKGLVLTSPNGSKWRLTVSDVGVLTTTSI